VGVGGAIGCVLTVGGLAPETGGPASTLPALCGALSRLGAGVELVSLDLGPELERPQVDAPRAWRLTLVRAFISRRLRITWSPSFAGAVGAACARLGNVVVHDNGVWLPSNHAVARVARRLGRPLLVSPRGMLLAWARQSKAAKKKIAWSLYQRRDLWAASAFHATSAEEVAALRELGLRQPAAIVANAVDVPPSRSRVRDAKTPKIVLFLSRLTRKKGLDSLLRVWVGLKPRGWKLVVAGPDEDGYGARLLKRWRRDGLGPEVEFVGPVWGEQKWSLFRQAGVFVLPSLSENFGIAIAEALGSGVPVITTRATPWRAIEENQCGWWIEAGDGPLAAALGEAMALPDAERARMGERGRALIEREYAPDAIARSMLAVYAWLLKMGPEPGCVVTD
jgi:glycosyltransferase involved in cell wall biosynthesis